MKPLLLAASLLFAQTAAAAPAYTCAGIAMPGAGAQILCSHIDPKAPAQSCNFFWSLMTADNTVQVVEGSFLLPPGASNAVVYQAGGFNNALASPIVLCQGR